MRSRFENEEPSEIYIEKQGETLVFELSGHVNELVADALSSKIDEIFENNQNKVIFDLSNVSFMGSSGLGQIMRVYRTVKDTDGYVKVVNPQPLIADLFELTKLDKLIDIFPTVDDALQTEDQTDG
ncbi:MAG: STAS domain-containing protein [Planctomycetes bacterium]|nr:STAS domain-containing protein [Planctomycetota bacterium]